MSRLLSSFAIIAACTWPVNAIAESASSISPVTASEIDVRKNQSTPSFARQSIGRGTQVQINDRPFSIPWQQWQLDTGEIQTEISDIGLISVMGIEFKSTEDPYWQPLEWFGSFQLPARHSDGDRYLEISDLVLDNGWQVRQWEDTLQIDTLTTQIQGVRTGHLGEGKRIVIDLDRPTPWQLEWRDRWVISIDATVDDIDKNETFQIRNRGDRTEIVLAEDISAAPRVFTLDDRPRLVIDIGADPVSEFDILWHPRIRWKQKILTLDDRRIPAMWLELDLNSSQVNLRPIWGQLSTQTGTDALTEIARRQDAIAAVNAGFFNRNNQLPLGAIRSQGNWHSGPILHRGVVAWNDEGEFIFDRLSIVETIVTADGDRFPILHLNSGYVSAGIARYTPEWGNVYTNILDRETLLVVADDRVLERIETEKAGQTEIAIPNNGYLLVIRSDSTSVSHLEIDTEIAIEFASDPPEVDRFPYIVGAGPLLLQNNRIVLDPASEQFNPQFSIARAVRSAIGRRSDGNLIILAIQGNVTLAETAEIVRDLGAIDALNLDGGSSTALYLGGELINRDRRTAAPIHNAIGIFINQP